jgi:hypothetical protein
MRMKRSTLLSAGLLGVMIFAFVSCAPTKVTVLSETATKLPRPDRIFVYDFAVSPDEVKLDRGIGSQIEAYINKPPRTAEEKKIGHGVAESVAKHLVTHIESLGFIAQRTTQAPPAGIKALEIDGQFISIDEGNKTERVVIGLGAGRSDVKTYVQAYDATGGKRTLVAQFQVDAKSGAKPGMAEMTAVGALAGHALVSALVSGGIGVGADKYMAGVDADGRRTAEEIVKKALGPFFVAQGWIPQSMLEQKGFGL